MENEDKISGSLEASGSESVASPHPIGHQDGNNGEESSDTVNDNVSGGLEQPELSGKEIMKALEAVERDSVAIADSFSSLFASLRLSLSEATSSTVDHMSCFSDAAGRIQECVLDASTKGNRYINSCLRLNEEMKGMDTLATQLKILRRHVDALDSAVDRLVRFP